MLRDEAIAKLKVFEPRLRALGATGLYLFGSTARNEATSSSDLDLFVEVDPTRRFSLLDLVEARRMVENDLGLPVEVATRDGLHPIMRDQIERQAIKVF